jgi:hypothetical protein
MMSKDFIDIGEIINRSIFNSIESNNLENDYHDKNIKHFLVSGLSGTGKTEIINELYKDDLLIAFSHGEESKNGIRKTLFQCLFEEINKPFNHISIKSIDVGPLAKANKINIYRVLDYSSIPDIVKSTYFERLPFFHEGYFLNDHYEEIQEKLKQFKERSFFYWLEKKLSKPRNEIESIWQSFKKLDCNKVDTLPDSHPFYIVSNYHFLTNEEKDTLFKGVPISKESICLYTYKVILDNNRRKLSYKPLMNLEGIRNNITQRIDVRSFDAWYKLNKRSVNIELFRKRFVTPYILYNMYLKDNLKVDLSKKTLFVDDYQLFAKEEIEILTKMMRIANRTFLTYDPIIKIFDFRNEKPLTENLSTNIEEYIKTFSPKVYKLTKNYRVKEEDWLINEANEELKQTSLSTTWRYSNSVSSKANKVETHLIENLKKTEERVGIVFRTNEQIEKFCEILIKNNLSFTRVTNNFLETYIGNLYVTFLFKFLLSNNPSENFKNFIKKNRTFNIIDWPKFQKYKEAYQNFNLEKPDFIFDVFNDKNNFKHIAYFLLYETKAETLEIAMHEYLDKPFLYIYHKSHYYNQVYVHAPLINILTFHKLKQISHFDRVIFPLIKDDSRGYNYLAISKAKKGYGLFPFQVSEGNDYHENNQEIMRDFESKISIVTLFNKM